jgi:hypothetical protein
MKREQYRQEELIRLMKWIAKHESDWEKLCGEGIVSASEYEKLLKILYKEKFYDMILILVACNQEVVYVKDFFHILGIQKFAQTWNEGNGKKFMSFLKNEINKVKERELKI